MLPMCSHSKAEHLTIRKQPAQPGQALPAHLEAGSCRFVKCAVEVAETHVAFWHTVIVETAQGMGNLLL